MKVISRFLMVGALALSLGLLALPAEAKNRGQVREYWVAAQAVDWDYAPSGENLMRPEMGLGPWGDTTVYPKYRYIQYTDGSYTTPVPQPEWRTSFE